MDCSECWKDSFLWHKGHCSQHLFKQTASTYSKQSTLWSRIDSCQILKYVDISIDTFLGITSQSLTSWRSGTSTGSLTTWWPRFSSLPEHLFGHARITMEMCSRTFWLRVSAPQYDSSRTAKKSKVFTAKLQLLLLHFEFPFELC